MNIVKCIICIFAVLSAVVSAQTALTGLGGSTASMVDRDGDGYGPGPPVVLNTTVAATINSGAQSVTPASMVLGTTTASTYNYTETGVSVTVGGLVTGSGGSGFKIGSGSIIVGTYIIIPGAGCPTVATVLNACTVASVSSTTQLQLSAGTYIATSNQTATWATQYVNLTSSAAMEPGEAISTATVGLLASPTSVIGSGSSPSLGNTSNDVLLSPAPLLPFSGQTATLSIGANMRLRIYQLDANNNVLWPGDANGNGHMEYVQVSSVTTNSFTASFAFKHDSTTGTIHVTDIRSLGPDADDLDATVHTAAQGISKYGTLTAFIKALYTPSRGYYNAAVNTSSATFTDYVAYNPTRFWCLSTAGIDGTVTVQSAAESACASPYLTWNHIAASVTGGDMVILRSGFNDRIAPPSGTAGSPTVVMGYPGEWPVFDSLANPNADCGLAIAVCGVFINNAGVAHSHIVLDGLRFQNSGTINLGDSSYFQSTHDMTDIILRHIDAGFGNAASSQACWAQQMAGFQNLIIEDTACHDSGEHGEYIGGTFIPSSGLRIWRNVLANNGWSNFGGESIHINGNIPGAVVQMNYIAGFTNNGIALQSGVSNSTIASNVIVSTNPSNDTISLGLLQYKNGYDCGASSPSVVIGTAACTISNATWASTNGGQVTITIGNPGTGINFFVGGYVYAFGMVPSGFNCKTTQGGCLITAVSYVSNTVTYQCTSFLGSCATSNPGSFNAGSSAGRAGMGPADATGNLIENNTFVGQLAGFQVVKVLSSCLITMGDCPGSDVIAAGSLDNQTFRNNLLINNGGPTPYNPFTQTPVPADDVNNPHMAVTYNNSLDGASLWPGANYLLTATFDHNLFFDLNDPTGAHSWAIGQSNTCGGTTSKFVSYSVTGVAQYGGCSNLSGTVLTGNLWGDPRMVTSRSAMMSYVFSEAFDMRVLNTSPAFRGGSATSLPPYDALGRSYIGGGNPSIGGLERNLYQYGWNSLGVGLYNNADVPANHTAVCPLDGAPGSATCGDGITTCGGYAPGGGGVQSPTIKYQFQSNCSTELGDYGGGILEDKPQSEAMIFGDNGGHGDSADSAVQSININLLTPTIVRLHQTCFTPPDHTGLDVLTISCADGTPLARHTWQSIAWIPDICPVPATCGQQNTYFVHNGSPYAGVNGNYQDAWGFSLATNTWMKYTGGTDPTNSGQGPVGALEYDWNSGYVFGYAGSNYKVWNPASPTTVPPPSNEQSVAPADNPSATIDTLRRVFWTQTDWNQGGGVITNGLILAFPIATPTVMSSTVYAYYTGSTNPGGYVLSDSSASAWAASKGAGLVYNQTHDTLLTIPGAALTTNATAPGNTVYLVNPVPNASPALVSTVMSVPGTPPNVSGAKCQVHGIMGHFRYSRGLDAYPYVPCYGTDAGILSLQPSDPVDLTCSIMPTSLGPWTNTQVINQTLQQSGCTASNWSLSGSWPTGLSGCNSGSGTTCTVSGTINMPSGGTSTPSVSYSTATNNYSITVNPAPSITTSCPLPDGNQLSPYSDTLTSSGGTSPLTWSLSSGSLPNGLTLSTAGVISGTPTLSGTSNFTLQVTDANNISATKSCSLFIIQTIPQLGTASGKTVSGQAR